MANAAVGKGEVPAGMKRLIVSVLVAAVVGVGPLASVRATIQEESCWDPDIEYPVPCDDDEE